MSIGPAERARSGAFTLLEITLAVAILAMMAVAIYRFVEANLTSLRVSSETSAADARYGGLRDLLTAQWQTLPGTTSVLTGEPFKFGGRPRDIEMMQDGVAPNVVKQIICEGQIFAVGLHEID